MVQRGSRILRGGCAGVLFAAALLLSPAHAADAAKVLRVAFSISETASTLRSAIRN